MAGHGHQHIIVNNYLVAKPTEPREPYISSIVIMCNSISVGT